MLRILFSLILFPILLSALPNPLLQGVDINSLSPAQQQMALQFLNNSQQGMVQPQIMQPAKTNNVVSKNATTEEEAAIDATLKMSLIEKEYNQIDIEHTIPILANQFIEQEVVIKQESASENQTEENTKTVVEQKEVPVIQTTYRNNLYQYGYNFFNHYAYYFPTNQSAVPDSYELQNGDRVTLIIYGKKEQVMDLVLDNQGDVILPNIGLVNLSGLTVSEANKKLTIQLRKKFVNFESVLKLSGIQDVFIFISGNVNQPGSYSVNKFESIFSVLAKAQGIHKSGSLRNIKVVSTNGAKRTIDLYNYFLNGNTNQLLYFNEGDVLYVPGIGSTVAITGEVNQPAIFEVKPTDTVDDVIRFASGPGLNAHLSTIYINGFDNTFKRKVSTLSAKSPQAFSKLIRSTKVKNGDVIYLNKKSTESYGYLNILGNVNIPGRVSYKKGINLGQLIKEASGLKLDSYETVHVFRYESNERRALIAVPLNDTSFKLDDRDVVMIYNKNEQQEKRQITIIGEVQTPGDYFYFDGMTVEDALILSKPNNFASLYNIEVARYVGDKSEILYVAKNDLAQFKLEPFDQISVKKDNLRDQTISIELNGEFMFPGTYLVTKGTRLSEVIRQAGGYTESAYLKGAVFVRQTVQIYDKTGAQKVIEDERRRYVYDQSHLGSLAADSQIAIGVMSARQEALEMLEKEAGAISGRVIIDIYKADFDTSNDNFIIQDGDELTIPTQPESIHLIGGVQQGISIAYNPRYNTQDYIQNVGGFTKYADADNVYVFKSSGRVFQNSQNIEPGDIIYVPEKVRISFNWLKFLTNITQIVSNAVTSIALINSLQ